MKKVVFLIVIMIVSTKLYSQQSDSITYCEVPIYTIIEKSFFNTLCPVIATVFSFIIFIL